jgi:hypothetical protein
MISSMTRPLATLTVALITCSRAWPQPLPDLARTKDAAEHGDPIAEDAMGQRMVGDMNFTAAVTWFRKAAEKGNVHAQYQLGDLLLKGITGVPQDGDEGLKWMLTAANNGNFLAQTLMGNFYEGGPWVSVDYIEAYKWYRVASKENPVVEHMHLDRLVLKMTREQIDHGEQRAKEFKVHQTTLDELPPPQYLKQIVLKGIVNTNDRRLAVINGRTFEKGEQGQIKVGKKSISLRCMDISENSAVVMVDELNRPIEIWLK